MTPQPHSYSSGAPGNSIPHQHHQEGEGCWYPGLGWGPPKDTPMEKCGKGSPKPGQAPHQLETSVWPEAALAGDPRPRPGPTLGRQSSNTGPI